MTQDEKVRAADLPEGAIVGSKWDALIKNQVGQPRPWRSTDGEEYDNAAVDRSIRDGAAEVLSPKTPEPAELADAELADVRDKLRAHLASLPEKQPQETEAILREVLAAIEGFTA